MIISDLFSSKQFLRQALTYVALVIVGLLVWLVFENFLSPESVALNRDYTILTKSLDTHLETQALSIMEQKRTFTASELENFSIYLTVDNANQNSNTLTIRRLTPATPLDLSYFSLIQSASRSTVNSSASATIDN